MKHSLSWFWTHKRIQLVAFVFTIFEQTGLLVAPSLINIPVLLPGLFFFTHLFLVVLLRNVKELSSLAVNSKFATRRAPDIAVTAMSKRA